MTNAVIAACVALVTVYMTQFVAMRYREHREGTALAAGILGELRVFRELMRDTRTALFQIADALKTDKRDVLTLRPTQFPQDVFYKELATKVGLLRGHAEQIVLVYATVSGVRSNLQVLFEKWQEMDNAEMAMRVNITSKGVDLTESRLAPLVSALEKRVQVPFNLWKS